MFQEKDDRGTVASTHNQGKLVAPTQEYGLTWFASFMVMTVNLMTVNVK
jgi:hypothetical protein